MKFIDLFDDEFIEIRSPFLLRMDQVPVNNLMRISEKYTELEIKKGKFLDKYDFINELIEGKELSKESYSNDEMRALRDYLTCARRIDDYERLEIYKLGYHDCMIWMKMIGL